MKRIGLGLFVLAIGLACGGMPNVESSIQPHCDAQSVVQTQVELAKLPIAAVAFEAGPTLEIGPDDMFMDFSLVQEAELEARLKDRLEQAKLFGQQPDLLLAVGEQVPNSRVVPVVAAAQRAGFARVRFVVQSQDENPEPVYVDPAYAAQLLETTEQAAPEDRARLLAQELEGLLVACPGGQNTFMAVANASSDMRCKMMVVGLAEALPSCVLTDRESVVTMVQVMTKPPPFALTTLDLPLDTKGHVFTAPADAAWSTLATSLSEKSGTPGMLQISK